jgi:hypothetical protein
MAYNGLGIAEFLEFENMQMNNLIQTNLFADIEPLTSSHNLQQHFCWLHVAGKNKKYE